MWFPLIFVLFWKYFMTQSDIKELINVDTFEVEHCSFITLVISHLH